MDNREHIKISKGLEALERLKKNNAIGVYDNDDDEELIIIEKELKSLGIIRKCFYVAESSGAILLTSYGFEHKEELKEVLKDD